MRPFLENTDAVIIVFDFSKIESIAGLKFYSSLVMSDRFDNVDCALFIVGTKKDKIPESVLNTIEKGKALSSSKTHLVTRLSDVLEIAEELGGEYWPVSAHKPEQVKKLFRWVIRVAFCKAILKNLRIQEKRKENLASERVQKKKRKSWIRRKIKWVRKIF